jgi:aspartyl-tRNA(Asn)/glutamyl-tRNA(Gln) amidotransferase subunit A
VKRTYLRAHKKTGGSNDSIFTKDLAFATIAELSVLLARGKISPVEITTLFLERIERHNPSLNAYLTVTRDAALAAARESEKRFKQKRSRGPLEGIPISLKDNIWTRGIRTTAGSKFLENFVPEEDATVTAKLRRAGAIILGKTNLHEFAYGVSTNNPHFGPTRNPWDTTRIPGGSSGGSAAAIAAGLCAASVGTDTGGSIRIPAALCGIVGLKPTFGRVSCRDVVALVPTFDHVGPLARSAGDAALILGAIAGRDPFDANTLSQPRFASFADVRQLAKRLRVQFTKKRPLKLGLPREYFFASVSEDIREAVKSAVRSFEQLGAIVEEVSLPNINDGDDASTTIALAEATHYHQSQGWFPAHLAEYGDDVRKRLEMGLDIRAADYLAAREIQKSVRAEFDAVLTRVDAIIAPTVPITAPRIGQNVVQIESAEEPARGALIRLNRPANFTGLPAISLPCGWSEENLPIGLQLIGRAWGEEQLLIIAKLFEEAHPEFHRHPSQF